MRKTTQRMRNGASISMTRFHTLTVREKTKSDPWHTEEQILRPGQFLLMMIAV